MSIEDQRRSIDDIDDRIVDLLVERARLAKAIGRSKSDAALFPHAPERERQLLKRLERRLRSGSSGFPEAALRNIYREILSACLAQQTSLEIAFLGPRGTFTHMAAQRGFGLAARYVECATIAAVFDAVERGHARYGVVPIENSTEGGVTFTLDELFAREVRIWGEVVTDISHCLVRRRPELDGIERIHSHPQALAQCRQWLAKNLPAAQWVVAPSTSAAARSALEDDAGAAIASQLAAELSNLAVVRDSIQDRAVNVTRFAVLALGEQPKTQHDKTSIVFSLKHERGALRRALGHLEGAGLNLTRIESRPHPSELWEYVFFTDFDGHASDPAVVKALTALGKEVSGLKTLGSYPHAAESAHPTTP